MFVLQTIFLSEMLRILLLQNISQMKLHMLLLQIISFTVILHAALQTAYLHDVIYVCVKTICNCIDISQ